MDVNIIGEEQKSSPPVILDNVENFMLNIEEEIKNQEEDNGDLDDDFHNDVDDVADTETDEEVDEKHLILEEIKLLELPEADRQKQRVVSTEKMEYKIMRSQNNPSKNYEETEPIMDPMEVDYETETVKVQLRE